MELKRDKFTLFVYKNITRIVNTFTAISFVLFVISLFNEKSGDETNLFFFFVGSLTCSVVFNVLIKGFFSLNKNLILFCTVCHILLILFFIFWATGGGALLSSFDTEDVIISSIIFSPHFFISINALFIMHRNYKKLNMLGVQSS